MHLSDDFIQSDKALKLYAWSLENGRKKNINIEIN